MWKFRYLKFFIFITIFWNVKNVYTRTISAEHGAPECTGKSGEILNEIRKLMKNSEFLKSPEAPTIQAYIIPMNDAHQSEYIGERDKRIKYVTEFSGSQGLAIVTEKDAAFWTDSRYHLQAGEELDLRCWTLMKEGKQGVPSPEEWLKKELPSDSRIGVDPLIVKSSIFKKIKEYLNGTSIELVGIERNLIDEIWQDQPPMSQNKIEILDIQFSGEAAGEKVSRVEEMLKENNAESIIITALDEIAWLLNLRGSDIPFNPVFYSYVILSMGKVTFFVDPSRINKDIRNHLHDENVEFEMRNYEDILDGIKELVKNTDGKIFLSTKSSQAVLNLIPTGRLVYKSSFISNMKAIKNEIEAKNIRSAHVRDAVALIRYLHWLEENIDSGEVTELSGAGKLAEFRSKEENFKGLSFEAISAFGSNAAIVHYSPTEKTNKLIGRDEMYLIDSGGQYLDGTTDVTRTVHYGEPTDFEKECFTRVLKGFIGVVTSIVPVNTSFTYLDYIGRRYLWQVGLNYGHGTGHGIGSYLNVHEYPPLISSSPNAGPIMENMFSSDEPGYYKDGQFGIRLEDIVQIVKSNLTDAFDGRGALALESVTMVPIQTKLIDTKLLTKDEENYINHHHQLILDTIGPILLSRDLNETYKWLVNETKFIKRK